mmetsp:Transcript_109827/g.212645  ORF Transcript_109827/g.212645 Transcript_109827/m.212645 type:complete len:83 (-) Transcript_109827:1607-1855(-)
MHRKACDRKHIHQRPAIKDNNRGASSQLDCSGSILLLRRNTKKNRADSSMQPSLKLRISDLGTKHSLVDVCLNVWLLQWTGN